MTALGVITKTGLFFAEQMGLLNQAGIPVFVLHGNHDAESQITRPLALPDNVRVFGARKAQTFQLDKPNVALHGRSFREKAVTDNLVPDYPAPVKGAINIGVLHTALGGMGGHANYAPCSLPELVAKGYDYWALGHVHQDRCCTSDRMLCFLAIFRGVMSVGRSQGRLFGHGGAGGGLSRSRR